MVYSEGYMKRRKYIYTNKKHPTNAIMATILGIISMASLVIVISLTYQSRGRTMAGYGLTGLLAAIFSMVGFVMGALSLKTKDCYRIFPVLGTLINLVTIICLVFLYRLGIS